MTQAQAQHLLINAVHPEEFRVALVRGQSLEGFFIETATRGKFVGNIYKGIVTAVQPSLQAAFVNYGVEKNGFLPLSEIHPEYYSKETQKNHPKIQEVVQNGQEVLVQVTKEEIGNKGAALTTYISLAGRDVVLMPGREQRGVSRKIEDESGRERLKKLVDELKLPEGIGAIIRTVAEGRTKREISKDCNSLLRLWEEIKKRAQQEEVPALIHKERDLATRVIRDYYNPEIKSILVDDPEVHRQVKDFLKIISPRQNHVVKLYKGEGPIFNKYNLENQIEQIFEKKVPLKSGGYLVIEPTEALVTVDVNSGRATREDQLEETVFKVNMEAAAEIPRQLRLRDLGGLVVIDFIDMRGRGHIRDVEKKVRDEMKFDKAKTTIGRISKFGLMELSRQHLGLNIQRGSYRECEHCRGSGIIRSTEAAALTYLRKIWLTLAQQKNVTVVRGSFAPDVANYLLNQKRADLMRLEEHFGTTIEIEGVPGVSPGEGKLEFQQQPKEAQPQGKENHQGKEAQQAKDTQPSKESQQQKEAQQGKAKGSQKPAKDAQAQPGESAEQQAKEAQQQAKPSKSKPKKGRKPKKPQAAKEAEQSAEEQQPKEEQRAEEPQSRSTELQPAEPGQPSDEAPSEEKTPGIDKGRQSAEDQRSAGEGRPQPEKGRGAGESGNTGEETESHKAAEHGVETTRGNTGASGPGREEAAEPGAEAPTAEEPAQEPEGAQHKPGKSRQKSRRSKPKSKPTPQRTNETGQQPDEASPQVDDAPEKPEGARDKRDDTGRESGRAPEQLSESQQQDGEPGKEPADASEAAEAAEPPKDKPKPRSRGRSRGGRGRSRGKSKPKEKDAASETEQQEEPADASR
jgi:ribonuclease E